MLFEKLWVYTNSREMADIQQGYEAVVTQLFNDAEDANAQLFVATATWGLTKWEQMLGLVTDLSLDDQVRADRIRSKLRGSGVSTKEMIEGVAESYYNGDCDITEQYAEYTFTITFNSSKGRPPGLAQLKEAIEEIKPAHLAVIYVFLFTTHDELKPYTHDQLAAYTHDQLQELNP